MTPQELKSIMSHGLLSFPLTDFDAEGNFNAGGYAERLEWLAPYGASALFAAGGTGEFFSLTADEYPGIIRTAVDTCRGKVPIIAGAGGPTRFAIQCAQEAGVIVYNRGACKLKPAALQVLADSCPNLIGFKDGIGDIELMSSIYLKMGERFAYLGGLPTAEVYAAAYKALGTPVYSSAVFNFIPKTAMDFYEAVRTDDMATQHRLLKDFFMPYLTIRNRGQGYAVSIVKAGAALVGHSAGPVRVPLTELKPDEMAQLDALIKGLGPQ